MADQKDNIGDLRARIDQIDGDIVSRLDERARLAKAIGERKKAAGLAVFDPAREREVVDRVVSAGSGDFPASALGPLYREIMATCRNLEEPVSVAYLGPEGTFSHQVALREFGTSAKLIPQPGFPEVFHEVERGRVACGVVPVENSNEGAVTLTLDLLPDSEVRVVGEIYLEVCQNLMSRETSLANIRKVCTKAEVIAQCREWLRANLPGVAVEAVSSTAEAARLAKETPGVAAVAALGAAELNGLHVLARGIEDNPNNVTRFFIIGKTPPAQPKDPKTSLAVILRDEPGVLAKALDPLASAGVNMSKIESRPLKRRPWEYRFYIDVDGSPMAEPLMSALAAMRPACAELRILGTYEKAVRPGIAPPR